MLFFQWLNEVRKELAALITGSLLLAALGLYQAISGKAVSPWLYSSIALVFFGWAFYKVWAKQKIAADAARQSVYEGRPLFSMRPFRVVGSEEYGLHLLNCGGRPARHVRLGGIRSYEGDYNLDFEEMTVLQPADEWTSLAYRVRDKSRRDARLSQFLRDNPPNAAVVWWDIRIQYWDTDNAIKQGGVIRLCFDVDDGILFARAAPYTALGFKPPP